MFDRILVPVDLTKRAKIGVDSAASLAGGGKVEIPLLHVIERIEYVDLDELKSLYDKLETTAKRYLSTLARRLPRKRITVIKTVLVGKRVNTIVDFAKKHETDLIILACQPTGPSSYGNFGAISNQVALRASCNVLLLK